MKTTTLIIIKILTLLFFLIITISTISQNSGIFKVGKIAHSRCDRHVTDGWQALPINFLPTNTKLHLQKPVFQPMFHLVCYSVVYLMKRDAS